MHARDDRIAWVRVSTRRALDTAGLRRRSARTKIAPRGTALFGESAVAPQRKGSRYQELRTPWVAWLHRTQLQRRGGIFPCDVHGTCRERRERMNLDQAIKRHNYLTCLDRPDVVRTSDHAAAELEAVSFDRTVGAVHHLRQEGSSESTRIDLYRRPFPRLQEASCRAPSVAPPPAMLPRRVTPRSGCARGTAAELELKSRWRHQAYVSHGGFHIA